MRRTLTRGGRGSNAQLLTLLLNSVSGIQTIVLMFGDFSQNFSHITFSSKFEGYGVFRFHGNGLLKGYFYIILSKNMFFSLTVNFSSDMNRKGTLTVNWSISTFLPYDDVVVTSNVS